MFNLQCVLLNGTLGRPNQIFVHYCTGARGCISSIIDRCASKSYQVIPISYSQTRLPTQRYAFLTSSKCSIITTHSFCKCRVSARWATVLASKASRLKWASVRDRPVHFQTIVSTQGFVLMAWHKPAFLLAMTSFTIKEKYVYWKLFHSKGMFRWLEGHVSFAGRIYRDPIYIYI